MKITEDPSASGRPALQHPTSNDPIADLEVVITKLQANQRTPGTVEIRKGTWRALIVGWVIEILLSAVLIVFGIHGLVHHDSAPAVHPVAHAVADVTGTSPRCTR